VNKFAVVEPPINPVIAVLAAKHFLDASMSDLIKSYNKQGMPGKF
jgi:hypothetical protein